MSTVYITIFGLNTAASSDCYGLRALMESFLGGGDAAKFFAYDDPSLIQKIELAVSGFDRIVFAGHSHGGAAVKWVLDHWSVNRRPIAALAIFFDPAPESFHFGQFFSWQAADRDLMDRWHVPLSVCARAVCFYQRNEQIIPGVIGVCGVPFVPVPIVPDVVVDANGDLAAPGISEQATVQNINVTGWGLYHCHMLGDPRVQAIARALVWSDGTGNRGPNV